MKKQGKRGGKKPTTAQLNSRNYARCEWKYIAFIGTDDWGKIHYGISCTGELQFAPTDQNQFQ